MLSYFCNKFEKPLISNSIFWNEASSYNILKILNFNSFWNHVLVLFTFKSLNEDCSSITTIIGT